jgi:hypothetical protein
MRQVSAPLPPPLPPSLPSFFSYVHPSQCHTIAAAGIYMGSTEARGAIVRPSTAYTISGMVHLGGLVRRRGCGSSSAALHIVPDCSCLETQKRHSISNTFSKDVESYVVSLNASLWLLPVSFFFGNVCSCLFLI